MVVALQPAAAHLCVRPNGQHSPASSVRVADSVGRGRAPLYLLVEPVERDHDGRRVRDVVAAIEHGFAAGGGRSTTAALTAALQSASADLYEENRRSMPRDQRRLGAVCATVKGDTLFAAQVGGAGTWLCRHGRVRPVRTGAGALRAKLGSAAWIEPELVSVRLQPGDRVLFASGSPLVAGPRLGAALEGHDVETAAEALAALHARAGARTDFAMILIQFGGDTAAPARHAPAPAARSSRQPTPAARPTRSPATRLGARRPVVAESAARFVDDDVDDGGYLPRRRARPAGGSDLTQKVGAFVAVAAARVGKEIWTAFGAPPPRDPHPVVEHVDSPPIDDDPWAEPEPPPVRRPNRARLDRARLTERTVTRSAAFESADDDEPHETAEDRRARRGRSMMWLRTMIGVGVLAIVVGAGGYMAMGLIRERQAAEELSQRVAEAEFKEREAQAATDPALKRQLLEDARRLAEGSPKNGREAVRVNGVINRVVDQLDQLDGIVRLVQVLQLLAPDALGKDSEVAQVTVGDKTRDEKYLFALDRRGTGVHGFQVGVTGNVARLQQTPLFARGDKVGDVVLTDLKAITWVPLGGPRTFSALLCLDSEGHLVEYDPAAGRVSVSKLGAGVRDIRASAAWNGMFYVLDAGFRQLLRFQPAGTGYNPQPSSYFDRDAPIDYTAVADVAVDGDVYLLFGDGKIQKYQNGRAAPFAASVPGTPMRDASRLATSAATKSVYVADRGNRRVVQFSKTGEYQRQFVYNGPQGIFDSVDGFQVDEERGKLYLLSGGRLVVVDLPKT